MDIIKQADLKWLIEKSAEWCVSLYMPAHRAGRDQQQDMIRFRNLISAAQKKLIKYGVRRSDVTSLLRPAEQAITNTDFWQHQSDGLAIFIAPDVSKFYRLPCNFEEMLWIATNFHVKPLLPLVGKNERFYILAISMNEIRLFYASKDLVEDVELGEMPTRMKDVVKMDDPEKFFGFHTRAGSPGRGMRRAVFHGHGGKSRTKKTNIFRYFKVIDRRLSDLLDEKSIPMILAGVGYLLPIYHQANTYPKLLNQGLEGNPEEYDARDLQKLAWELVEPIIKVEQKLDLERFDRLYKQKSELVITDLEAVVKAAYFGLVETLFVPIGVHQWGKYQPELRKVILESESTIENDDLADFAAMRTILNSGKVYTVDSEKIFGCALAAILRYPME